MRGETPRRFPHGAVMKQPPRYPAARIERLFDWWLKWVVGGATQIGWNFVALIATVYAILLFGVRAW